MEPGFLSKVVHTAIPGGLTVALNILAVQLLQPVLNLDISQVRLISVIITGITGLIVLLHVSLPLNEKRAFLLFAMSGIFAAALLIFPDILELSPITLQSGAIIAILGIAAYPIMLLIKTPYFSCFTRKQQENIIINVLGFLADFQHMIDIMEPVMCCAGLPQFSGRYIYATNLPGLLKKQAQAILKALRLLNPMCGIGYRLRTQKQSALPIQTALYKETPCFFLILANRLYRCVRALKLLNIPANKNNVKKCR